MQVDCSQQLQGTQGIDPAITKKIIFTCHAQIVGRKLNDLTHFVMSQAGIDRPDKGSQAGDVRHRHRGTALRTIATPGPGTIDTYPRSRNIDVGTMPGERGPVIVGIGSSYGHSPWIGRRIKRRITFLSQVTRSSNN